MMFMGKSITNRAAATPRAAPRSARHRERVGFSRGESLTHRATVSRKPMAATVIAGVGS